MIDPGICPLCGGPNQCVHVGPVPRKGPCWCAAVVFPQELLDIVPDEAKHRACICRRCVEKFYRERNMPVRYHTDLYVRGSTLET
ncbi:MAG TPA: cysteine-rich CWC family protein [Verrucomicrobiae bacterium]|nr:cysteine-rich CWC family protein [Verrucomicrobiae bacterium]